MTGWRMYATQERAMFEKLMDANVKELLEAPQGQ